MVSIFKTGLNGHIWRQDPMLFAQQWSQHSKEHRVMSRTFKNWLKGQIRSEIPHWMNEFAMQDKLAHLCGYLRQDTVHGRESNLGKSTLQFSVFAYLLSLTSVFTKLILLLALSL